MTSCRARWRQLVLTNFARKIWLDWPLHNDMVSNLPNLPTNQMRSFVHHYLTHYRHSVRLILLNRICTNAEETSNVHSKQKKRNSSGGSPQIQNGFSGISPDFWYPSPQQPGSQRGFLEPWNFCFGAQSPSISQTGALILFGYCVQSLETFSLKFDHKRTQFPLFFERKLFLL